MYSNQGCPQTTPSGSNITPWGSIYASSLGIGTSAPLANIDIEGAQAYTVGPTNQYISNTNVSGSENLSIGYSLQTNSNSALQLQVLNSSFPNQSAPVSKNQAQITTGSSLANGLLFLTQTTAPIIFATGGYPGTQRGQFDSSGNFDVGSGTQFQVNSSGILKSYNNIATVGDGQPYTVGHANIAAFSTSQSGNVLASPVANHAYKLHYYMWQAASGTGTCSTNSTATLALTWNDPSATAQTQTFTALQIPPTLAAGAWQSGDLDVVTASGTAIAYSITYVNGNCATTQPTVQAQVWAEASN
jgi:hypothetical protein